jgi:hypothetical protein
MIAAMLTLVVMTLLMVVALMFVAEIFQRHGGNRAGPWRCPDQIDPVNLKSLRPRQGCA